MCFIFWFPNIYILEVFALNMSVEMFENNFKIDSGMVSVVEILKNVLSICFKSEIILKYFQISTDANSRQPLITIYK